jgi:excisionase family DNA binding protein
VARLVNISPSTVLAWIDGGLLPAHRTPGGHRRVAPRELAGFLRRHGMPVPRQLHSMWLLIDDDTAFLRTTTRLLRRRAPWLIVETADTPIDGLIKVGTRRPDAVVLDAYMPGMDGVEVCRRLKGSPETRDIQVVALTARPSAEVAAAFREAGAVGCLMKPFDVTLLFDALGLRDEERAP